MQSEEKTLGAELELLLLDPTSRELSPRSQELLDACAQSGITHVTSEVHASMFEVQSDRVKNARSCRENLVSRLSKIFPLADDLGLAMCSMGTHPMHKWSDRKIYPKARYYAGLEKFQWLFKQINLFSLHVHVGMKDGDRLIHTMNVMIDYLPHLLALSSSSPFWEEHDTGLESCRISVLQSFPTSGLPFYFRDWNEFQTYFDTLFEAGIVKSYKNLYWFIRPNLRYHTLEVRMCDALSSLDDSIAMIALIHCLIVYIDEELFDKPIRKKQFWLAPQNLWLAARYGLDATLIGGIPLKTSIKNLVEMLLPTAKKLDCVSELQSVLTLMERGTSATRQRATYKKECSFIPVIDECIHSLRSL